VAGAGVLAAQGRQGQSTPPQQPPVFTSGADVVPLTVTVLDRQGRPVPDLTPADFTIFENGQERQVLNFFRQAMGPGGTPAAAGAPAEPASSGIAPAQRRLFLIVLGFGRIQYPAKGVDGALTFVRERLLPGDAVAVMAFHRATDFTTDHRAIVRILERYRQHHERIVFEILTFFRRTRFPFSRGGPPLPDAMLSGIDADVFGNLGAPAQDRSPARLTLRKTVDLLLGMDRATHVADQPWQRQASFGDLLDTLARMGLNLGDVVVTSSRLKLFAGIEHMRDLEGERHAVVIAEDMIASNADHARTVARRAASARVAVDYVWTRGTNLRGSSGCPACRDVSDLTGGHYTSMDYADSALARIDQATRLTYLLGYAPVDPTLDGKYRDVSVIVNRPGVIVQFRHGYYAAGEPNAEEVAEMIRQVRVDAALAYDSAATDIPVSITAALVAGAGGKAQLQVDVKVDVSSLSLSLEERSGLRTGRIEIQVHCGDAREAVVGSLTQRLDLKATPETYATWARDGFRHAALVPVSGTPRFVKAVVYDYGSDRVGSVMLTLGARSR
jgi:VWFA-related protein